MTARRRLMFVAGRACANGCAASCRVWAAVLTTMTAGPNMRQSLLPGRVGRDDAVVFPVDCVSHWAMKQVRRLCVAQDRPFYALRSARITAFLGALPQIRAALTG